MSKQIEPIVGSKWVAAHAYGRKDAISFTVLATTEHGIYLASPEARSTLVQPERFHSLYRTDPRSR